MTLKSKRRKLSDASLTAFCQFWLTVDPDLATQGMFALRDLGFAIGSTRWNDAWLAATLAAIEGTPEIVQVTLHYNNGDREVIAKRAAQ